MLYWFGVDTNNDTDFEDPDLLAKRVNVPSHLWKLIERVAIGMDATPRWVFNMLLKRVDRLTLTGEIGVLGYEFEEGVAHLEHQGDFGRSPGIPQIDVSVLHRSDKVKSGFTGVYANGKGFRALATAPGGKGTVGLGTFPSAERAAEVRRLHFLKHNLPYGSVADQLATFSDTDKWKHISPETKRRVAIRQLADAGKPAEGLSVADRVWEHEQDPYIDAGNEAAAYEAKKEVEQAERLKQRVEDAKAKRTPPKLSVVASHARVDLTLVDPWSGVPGEHRDVRENAVRKTPTHGAQSFFFDRDGVSDEDGSADGHDHTSPPRSMPDGWTPGGGGTHDS